MCFQCIFPMAFMLRDSSLLTENLTFLKHNIIALRFIEKSVLIHSLNLHPN